MTAMQIDTRNQDLLSIQEARELLIQAHEAQEALREFDQARIDRIVEAMARAGLENAQRLATLAVEETGIGVVADKVVKNQFAAQNVAAYIREMRTVGIIHEDPARKVVEIAEPMGVVVGLVPTTNPTSTVIYKALISLKSRN